MNNCCKLGDGFESDGFLDQTTRIMKHTSQHKIRGY